MADIARFSGAGAKYGSNSIAGVAGGTVKLSPQLEKLLAHYDGHATPTLGATLKNEIFIDFDTRDINFITAPALIDATNTLVVYARAYANDGTAGAGYISFTIAKGLMVPQKLSASAGKEAVMSIRVYPCSSDGDTVPVAVGSSTHTIPEHGAAFTLGSLSLGADVANLRSFNLDFGYTVEGNAGENGKVFAREYYVTKQQAVVNAETADLSEATSARLNTGQALSASIAAIFPVLTEGGIPTASGQVTLTIAKLIAHVQDISFDTPAVLAIEGSPVEDASGNYLTWS